MSEQEMLEQLTTKLERLEAVQACRNLMGKYSYYHTAFRNNEYIDLWAKRDDDLLVMPWGSYKGFEGVKACYLKDHGDRNDPGMLDSLRGAVMMHEMDTEVIEVAKDGKTAKGAWISPGHESCFIPDFEKIPGWKKGDPVPPDAPMVSSCEWAWSKYQVD